MDKSKGTIVSLLFAILIVAGLVKIWQVTDLKKRNGIVMSHDVTANRRGDVIYNTLVKCDDGYIRKVEDMNTYIVPVGNRVTINTFN